MIWPKDFDTRYNIWVLARNHVLQMEITTVLKKKKYWQSKPHTMSIDTFCLFTLRCTLMQEGKNTGSQNLKTSTDSALLHGHFMKWPTTFCWKAHTWGGIGFSMVHWLIDGSLEMGHTFTVQFHTQHFPKEFLLGWSIQNLFFFKHWVFTKLDN